VKWLDTEIDLFDLLRERYNQIRKEILNQWDAVGTVPISHSEWLIIGKLYKQGDATISSIAKSANITRQASHKCMKSLEGKGIVEISPSTVNRKEKQFRLTKLGKDCFQTFMSIKASIERDIEEHIGQEEMALLKKLLQENWGY